jgi:hypothetical protein
MKVVARPLEEVVRELPPDLRDEVRDFAEFLLSRRIRRPGRTLRQDWAGALRDHQEEYTALELQALAASQGAEQ